MKGLPPPAPPETGGEKGLILKSGEERERTAFLNSLNIRVLRFMNSDVYDSIELVCEKIIEEIRNPSSSPFGEDTGV